MHSSSSSWDENYTILTPTSFKVSRLLQFFSDIRNSYTRNSFEETNKKLDIQLETHKYNYWYLFQKEIPLATMLHIVQSCLLCCFSVYICKKPLCFIEIDSEIEKNLGALLYDDHFHVMFHEKMNSPLWCVICSQYTLKWENTATDLMYIFLQKYTYTIFNMKRLEKTSEAKPPSNYLHF